MKPSVDLVRKIFDYEPEKGELRWRVQLSYRGKLGELAGSIQPRGKRQYRRVTFSGFRCYVHDVIWLYMTGMWPERDVDHEDLDGLNNRWHNLRLASRSENNMNKEPQHNNTSGAVGVCWAKRDGKWLVRVAEKFVGYFADFDEAVAARDSAAAQMFPGFSRSASQELHA